MLKMALFSTCMGRACGVVALFVRDGTLSYTGTGLLMGLFVLFVMQSIAYQYRFAFREGDVYKRQV